MLYTCCLTRTVPLDLVLPPHSSEVFNISLLGEELLNWLFQTMPRHLNGFQILSLLGPFDVVTHRANYLARSLEKFWRRWKREYLLELQHFHRASQPSGIPHFLRVGEIVTIYDDSHPRCMWRLGQIQTMIPGTSGIVHGVTVNVTSRSGHPRRPIQHVYPMGGQAEFSP